MRWPRRLDPLPGGFVVQTSGAARLECRADAVAQLSAAGYGPESDATLPVSGLSGRRPLFELATSEGVLLVRRFTHGGLLRLVTGARFRDPCRPFRELRVSAELCARGIATPHVVAARAQPARFFGWRLELVTRRVEGVVDVEQALARARRGELDPRALRAVMRAAGALVRRLHDSGCLHADLTTKNLLVNRSALVGGAPEVWVLDLDRTRILPHLSGAQRRGNLRRLYRFVARREAREGPALSRTDYARFLRGYDPQGARWKADWRAIARAHGRTLFLHALGWRLERLAAPPDTGR